jgi:hypothetical protein
VRDTCDQRDGLLLPLLLPVAAFEPCAEGAPAGPIAMLPVEAFGTDWATPVPLVTAPLAPTGAPFELCSVVVVPSPALPLFGIAGAVWAIAAPDIAASVTVAIRTLRIVSLHRSGGIFPHESRTTR